MIFTNLLYLIIILVISASLLYIWFFTEKKNYIHVRIISLVFMILSIFLFIQISKNIFKINKQNKIRNDYINLILNNDFKPYFLEKYNNDLEEFYINFIDKTKINNKQEIFELYKEAEFKTFIKYLDLNNLDKNLDNISYKPLNKKLYKSNQHISNLINDIQNITTVLIDDTLLIFEKQIKNPKTNCDCKFCIRTKQYSIILQ